MYNYDCDCSLLSIWFRIACSTSTGGMGSQNDQTIGHSGNDELNVQALAADQLVILGQRTCIWWKWCIGLVIFFTWKQSHMFFCGCPVSHHAPAAVLLHKQNLIEPECCAVLLMSLSTATHQMLGHSRPWHYSNSRVRWCPSRLLRPNMPKVDSDSGTWHQWLLGTAGDT